LAPLLELPLGETAFIMQLRSPKTMIESKTLKQAFKVHKLVQRLGTSEDAAKSADMLGAIDRAISENISLRQQLAYTKAKTK
jgi:hypothetical protein